MSRPANLDGTWFCDGWDDNLKILHRLRATLFDETSPYQRVEICDTWGFGRMLIIDGVPQAAEHDEALYAKALTWPALLARPSTRQVVITGGGDGHAAREILRFPDVRSVTICDIDPVVTRATQAWMPFMWSVAASDPRVKILHGDAIAYLDSLPEASVDLIVSDITDPTGPGSASERLYSAEYFRKIRRCLAPGGACVAQAQELSVKEWAHHQRLRRLVTTAFPFTESYCVYVPSFGYPEGFLIASASDAPIRLPADAARTRMHQVGLAEDVDIDAAVYASMFALPPRIRTQLPTSG